MICNFCGAEIGNSSLRCGQCGCFFPVKRDFHATIAKSTIFFYVEWIVLAVVLIVFFSVRSNLQRENMLHNYAEARFQQDWDYIYDLLALPDSGLLTKDFFFAILPETYLKQYSSYELTNVSYESTKIEATCTLYSLNGSLPSYTTLMLCKHSDGNWGLPSNFVALVYDAQIVVPTGSTVKLNGVDLATVPDVEITPFLDTEIFILPYMFSGNYTIEITIPGLGTHQVPAFITKDTCLDYTDREPSCNTVDTLSLQTSDIMETIFSGFANDVSYEVLVVKNPGLFSETEEFRSQYNEWLSKFKADFSANDSDISITNIKCSMVSFGTNSETTLPYIEMHFEGMAGSNNGTHSTIQGSLIFSFSDESWILTSLTLN